MVLNPKFEAYNFKLLAETVSRPEVNILLELEKSLLKHTKGYSIGVLYCGDGQTTAGEMLANTSGSSQFDLFLSCLGDVVMLNQFPGFAGGLDTKYESTGKFSVYTRVEGCDVMFHVSTMLAFDVDDPTQRQRMRFLSQDACVIVFQDEGSAPLSPDVFHEWGNVHVVCVVRQLRVRQKSRSLTGSRENVRDDTFNSFKTKQDKLSKIYYQVAVASKISVTPFQPYLENPVFERGNQFRTWLVTKMINGERSAYESETSLRTKREIERAEKLGVAEYKMQLGRKG